MPFTSWLKPVNHLSSPQVHPLTDSGKSEQDDDDWLINRRRRRNYEIKGQPFSGLQMPGESKALTKHPASLRLRCIPGLFFTKQ